MLQISISIYKTDLSISTKSSLVIEYYDSGSANDDMQYFLQCNNRLVPLPQERIYNDENCRSSRDNLAKGLLPNSIYKKYIEKRIK